MGFSIGMLGPLMGGVMGAYSDTLQAKAQEQQYLAQARMAESNRAIAGKQASESLKEGAREESKFRATARQFAASQEARLAASGRTISGSALGVMAGTEIGIEQDAEMIRYNTLKQKWGFGVQAANFTNEAIMARASAPNARRAGSVSAVSSMLGGLGGALALYKPVDAAAKNGNITINNPGNFGTGGTSNFVPPDSQLRYLQDSSGLLDPRLRDWYKKHDIINM